MKIPFSNRRPYRLGYALSGGGARAFAHAGALEAFEESGLKPDILAGVSAGAVTAVLYASGMRPQEMLELFEGESFSKLCTLAVPRDGFFRMDGFKKLLDKHLSCVRLEDLPIKTLVCATDMEHAQAVAFDSGGISERVAASCSIPIIFKPVKIQGVRYLDGGLLHNLPAWAIREQCRRVIGFNCSPEPKLRYGNTLTDVARASFNIAVKTNVRGDAALCDLLIEIPKLATYHVFDLKGIRRVYKQGYEAARSVLDQMGL